MFVFVLHTINDQYVWSMDHLHSDIVCRVPCTNKESRISIENISERSPREARYVFFSSSIYSDSFFFENRHARRRKTKTTNQTKQHLYVVVPTCVNTIRQRSMDSTVSSGEHDTVRFWLWLRASGSWDFFIVFFSFLLHVTIIDFVTLKPKLKYRTNYVTDTCKSWQIAW